MSPKRRRDGDNNMAEAQLGLPGTSYDQHGLREALDAERARADRLELALNGLREAKAELEQRVVDLERKADQGALLQSFAEAAPGALWVADARTGQGRYVSPGLEALLGTPAEVVLPEAGRWLGLVYADDRAAVTARFEAVRRGETAEIEYRVLPSTQDGGGSRRPRWVRDFGFPIRTAGQVRYVAGFVADADERRGEEGLRRLLLAELNHRVRNTLAAVHSLAAQTARAAPSPSASWSAFGGRLLALARAHDRLSEGGWAAGAELRLLLETELAPYLSAAGPAAGPRAMLDGPPVQLEPGSAVALALALHEMVTNAVRHGALSTPAGRVEVRWQIAQFQSEYRSAEGARLRIEWLERGGPPLAGPPAQRGFGSRLLERNLPRQLGGEVELRFDPAGLQAAISVPLRSGAVPAE
ncbi:PAS domain S-box protein [Dankookia rubra]|uniref:histidine kinase n=1 Tax=Dankookia rubra TaxID=1442381 RepID=A0A4R5QDG7_9PROT|nr:HWE histidine kinase domain-containing protein [Dankookia rubra]TDH60501.1 PAS domain S-box protein [Dankookia rubra]